MLSQALTSSFYLHFSTGQIEAELNRAALSTDPHSAGGCWPDGFTDTWEMGLGRILPSELPQLRAFSKEMGNVH